MTREEFIEWFREEVYFSDETDAEMKNAAALAADCIERAYAHAFGETANPNMGTEDLCCWSAAAGRRVLLPTNHELYVEGLSEGAADEHARAVAILKRFTLGGVARLGIWKVDRPCWCGLDDQFGHTGLCEAARAYCAEGGSDGN